jgi:hypothetical protein
MPELPAHSDTGPAVPEQVIEPTSRLRRLVIIGAVVAVVVLFVVLHLTGVVGAESH